MGMIDRNLRVASKGGVTAEGKARTLAFKGERRYGGTDHLGGRLKALNWAWSTGDEEDQDIEPQEEYLIGEYEK